MVFLPLQAQATLGLFEHGNGIKSMGIGGVGYSFAEETTVLGANPAHALALGNRFDIGVDVFRAEAEAIYENNNVNPDQFDPNQTRLSDGRRYYAIPQGGVSMALSERWAVGVAVLSAGLGADYSRSPYVRFGGGHRTSLQLASSSVVTALAYQLNEDHALGLSLNTGYQVLSVEGLEFLDNAALSESPGKVTNQGKDGAFTLGFTLGWHGRLTPWLSAGLAYRSKNWTEKHEDYAGLIAEGGRLELPSIYGGGIAITPAPNWTLVLEAQRYTYRKQTAFRNGIGGLEQGVLLGSADGPGFGFNDQNAYKLGIGWQATPKLMLRAGYIYNTKIVQPSETLFGFLGCLTTNMQYALGATYQLEKWEVTGLFHHTPREYVYGRDSIPAAFGGGEANVSDMVIGLGISFGRRFGR